jgi:hypothetical protein
MQREIIVQEIRHELAAKEKKLLDMEQSLEKVRRDMARRSKDSHRKARIAHDIEKRETNVKNARKEVEQAQDAHKKFSGRKGELYKGALGGVASGVASGVVAGGKLSLVQKNNWTKLLTRYHVSSCGRTCVYSNVMRLLISTSYLWIRIKFIRNSMKITFYTEKGTR